MLDATNPPRKDPGSEPRIIIVAIQRTSYYLFKGDEFLDQLLLADGVFPTPALCVHFDSLIDAAQIIGAGFSTSNYWAVNPEIVDRLRRNKQLAETEAKGS